MIKVTIQPQFVGMPPEIALAMFEEMMEMQELIDRGVRCIRCGELVLPEDAHDDDLCQECAEDLINIALEMEARQREVEEKVLEEMADFLKIVSLLKDDYPIDLRNF